MTFLLPDAKYVLNVSSTTQPTVVSGQMMSRVTDEDRATGRVSPGVELGSII